MTEGATLTCSALSGSLGASIARKATTATSAPAVSKLRLAGSRSAVSACSRTLNSAVPLQSKKPAARAATRGCARAISGRQVMNARILSRHPRRGLVRVRNCCSPRYVCRRIMSGLRPSLIATS